MDRNMCCSGLWLMMHNGEYCSYLVPEEEIRLTKLKLLYVKHLHERKSHDIEA